MANPTWSKEMAAAIIKAGFRSLAQKHHPDHGGKHEAMLVLEKTREHLEQLVDGWRGTYGEGDRFDREDPLGGRQKKHDQAAWDEWIKRQQEEVRRRAREQEQRAEEAERRRRTNKREDYKGPEIPLEPYAVGWYCVKETILVQISDSGKAFQVMFPGVDEPFWLPKSQLHKTANKIWVEADRGTCVFSAWIAKQKGWI